MTRNWASQHVYVMSLNSLEVFPVAAPAWSEGRIQAKAAPCRAISRAMLSASSAVAGATGRRRVSRAGAAHMSIECGAFFPWGAIQ